MSETASLSGERGGVIRHYWGLIRHSDAQIRHSEIFHYNMVIPTAISSKSYNFSHFDATL